MFAPGHLALSRVLMQLGRVDEARLAELRAAELNPRRVRADQAPSDGPYAYLAQSPWQVP